MRFDDRVAAVIRDEPRLLDLQQKATRLGQQILELCHDKVVAHHDDPQHHPLPASPQAIERVLFRAFEALPLLRRRRVLETARARLKSSNRAAYYGPLATVDLRSPVPILDQVKPRLAAVLPRIEEPEVRRVVQKLLPRQLLPRHPLPRAALPDLGLFLQHVLCEEKTREAFEGRDEIKLKVFGVSDKDLAAGRQITDESELLDLGKFKQGEGRSFDDLLLVRLPLAADPLPQGFKAILQLTETDRARVDDRGAAQMILLIGLIVLTIAGVALAFVPDGIILFVLLYPLLLSLTKWAVIWFLDDPFEGGLLRVFPSAPNETFPQESIVLRRPLDFAFTPMETYGRYRLTYSWKLI